MSFLANFISIKRTNSKLAQIVFDRLGQVPPTVNHILDEAVIVARKYFEDKEARIDNYLFPSLVRYEAKILFELPEYKSIGYEFASLSNNGLFIIYKCDSCYYKIRVRKADEDGELPVQNLSKTLKKFYQNPNPFLPTIEENLEKYVSPERLNLIVVWDVDKNYHLKDVHLVCPKNEYGDVYFADRIEHAATAIVGNANFDEQADDLDDIDILPLRKTKIL